MPGGSFVKGMEHKTRHLNVVIQGKVLIYDEKNNEIGVIVAPCTFESDMGVAKTLYIHEDTIWQTIHSNPDDCQDVGELEERLVFETSLEDGLAGELQDFKDLMGKEASACRS